MTDTHYPATPSDESSPARLIGLDWGTSSCRAYLIDGTGQILASTTGGLGVLAMSAATDRAAAFDDQLKALVGDWLRTSPGLPMVACGMVGSDQGWSVAAYKETPADLVNSSLLPLTEVSTTLGTLHIVPGLLSYGTPGKHGTPLPNVMRGEETQILGVVPEPPDESTHVVILPGTHTKWAQLKGSTVTDFATSMTGEIHALLLQHSILGRTAQNPAAPDLKAFEQGLDVVFGSGNRSPAGDTHILSTLFSARTLPMTGALEPAGVPDYISGLLIGTAVAGFTQQWLADAAVSEVPPTVTICANDALARRYAHALLRTGTKATVAAGTPAAAGLWRIALLAGLTERETP
ncbi:2-dehydro-3-deoxygalactonokinase [Paenarthrobacter sp. CM16]|uniref:2-dehydro-3-deoxygalactonokinase n=1 Tax=Paenarthrobacter sp. CM16 TaxID=2738447 RepID=UPI0015557553|nr:2-dehydro-3-deoxygalactonokinase [Paenarthrobacter sp. CM16]NQD86890.1 2-dehydro-3-deoxygalactonokinase [Paenarthrobacter sp. CM16]